jgi:tetratricopeptide (TPR) repeat protein
VLDEAGLKELAPEGAQGWYGPGIFGEPVAVVGAERHDRERIILHEVAHQLIAAALARQPTWFAEGVASYLETVEVRPRSVRVNGLNRLRAVAALGTPRVSVEELLRWTGGAARPGYYGRAWLLVHYLVNERAEALARYQERLARAEDPVAAWSAELPEFDARDPYRLRRLDATLDAYLTRDRWTVVERSYEPPVARPTERLMTASEVHAARLSIPLLRSGTGPDARAAEVAEALREDPGHPLASARLARGRSREEQLTLAREAALTHPGAWEAWTLLAGALPASERCDRVDALRRAATLAPERAEVLNDLAWVLVEAGRAADALPVAERALRLEPWSAPVLDTYAAAVAANGRCADAVGAEQRALELVREGDTGRDGMAARLDVYRAGCAAPAAASMPMACPDDPRPPGATPARRSGAPPSASPRRRPSGRDRRGRSARTRARAQCTCADRARPGAGGLGPRGPAARAREACPRCGRGRARA